MDLQRANCKLEKEKAEMEKLNDEYRQQMTLTIDELKNEINKGKKEFNSNLNE